MEDKSAPVDGVDVDAREIAFYQALAKLLERAYRRGGMHAACDHLKSLLTVAGFHEAMLEVADPEDIDPAFSSGLDAAWLDMSLPNAAGESFCTTSSQWAFDMVTLGLIAECLARGHRRGGVTEMRRDLEMMLMSGWGLIRDRSLSDSSLSKRLRRYLSELSAAVEIDEAGMLKESC